MRANQLPAGWDEKRVREVLDYYENQSDEEAAIEHEEALSRPTETLMEVPVKLVPVVRELIARFQED